MDSCAKPSKKVHIILFPFFGTSHIRPFTDLAVNLVAARPNDIRATVVVTPANVTVVESALSSWRSSSGGGGPYAHAAAVDVAIATYAFPAVEAGLPPGVENMSDARQGTDEESRIVAAACDEAVMRPPQERLVRELSPDVVVTDLHFFWNACLGVPCVSFNLGGVFPTLAMARLASARQLVDDDDAKTVTIPGFPAPEIRIPVTELPEFLRMSQHVYTDPGRGEQTVSALRSCIGQAMNTFYDLEHDYCELYKEVGYIRRAYFVGPLSLPLVPPASRDRSACLEWLDTKAPQSVVYLCFGSLATLPEAQLNELALGLEASISKAAFLWVVRAAEGWTPPEGWTERVGDRGMLVRGWAPQVAILGHPAVAAFVTQCGWNAVLEAVTHGVPVLTWPVLFEQFITERLVTEVLRVGERLWPEGAGVRSTRSDECELVPAAAVAQAVARFVEPGGSGERARRRVQELSVKARAAVVEGGSSHHDLQCLIDDIMEACRARVAAA
ncbi:hypothetical protein HU200_063493 [Digitaria exilis]|uniref:Glycosyltransferase n=1 Tax=Digitaria exilis TaxID=1010633 RepID=A0A835A5Q2_9POAL|nr:hypothetical protein HU200_063493 [Digitaria exilis]CAB3488341.1 unnamed protein product [Digitaria exilis]